MTETLERRKPCILTVDDDRTTLAMLAITIRRAGYDIVQASSAEEALDVIAESEPDLAVLDISMPGMSGIELARRLRDETAIPFMFLSTHTEPDIVREAGDQGAVGYLIKPIDFHQVVSVIEAGLAQAELKRRLPGGQRRSCDQMRSDQLGRYAELAELQASLEQAQCRHEQQSATHAEFRFLDGTIERLCRILNAYRGTSAASMRDVQARTQLTAIRSRLLLNLMRTETPGLRDEYRQISEQLLHIVRSLKNFSLTGPSPEWQRCDLNAIVDAAVDHVVRGGAAATIHKHYSEHYSGSGILVECLRTPMEQAFEHLLVNAMQSVGDGVQARIGLRTAVSQGHAWAEISDNGCGIAPAERELIFQPFFSSKPPGAGLGLGLTVSREIVRMHAGDIAVNSNVGAGTVFRVSLPLLRASPRER